MHGKLNVLDFSAAKGDENVLPKYEFSCNASHVHIYKDGKLVTQRVPSKGPWYDEKHKAVVKAMEQLEKAVLKLAKE